MVITIVLSESSLALPESRTAIDSRKQSLLKNQLKQRGIIMLSELAIPVLN